MSTLLKIATSALFFFIGAILGGLITDIPRLTLKTEVGIGDIANFILALVIAFLIPISLNVWLDNKRHIKDFLIEEIKISLTTIDFIKKKIDNCCLTEKTQRKDISEIMLKLKESEMQVNSLINQLSRSFRYQSKSLMKELPLSQSEYWKRTTDADLLKQDFQINSSFCKDHDVAFYKFQTYLKECVHIINNF